MRVGLIAHYNYSYHSTGEQVSIHNVFNTFASEALLLIEHQNFPDLDISQASPESLFDTLQCWALDFAQFVLEPIVSDFRRLQSRNEHQSVVSESSVADNSPQAVSKPIEPDDSKQRLSKPQDSVFPAKRVQKMPSLEMKTLADAVFILSNVSSSCCVFAPSSHVLQVKRFILRVQAALLIPEPCSNMVTTLQQLLEKFQSIGCYSQLFEQYL